MIGAVFKGVCYPSMTDAITAFAGTFPQVVNGNMQVYNYTGIVVDHDFAYNVLWYDANSQVYFQEYNASLQSCTLPDDLVTSVGGINFSSEYILFCCIFIVAMMGFRAGFRP